MFERPDLLVDLFFVLHWTLAVVFALRVIMQRNAVGVTMAWLILIFFVPVGGSVLYFILGEIHLGKKRTRRAEMLIQPFKYWINERQQRFQLEWSKRGESAEALSRHAYAATNLPTMPGNELELMDNCQATLQRIIEDIRGAREHIHMEFYIWHPGGLADEVMETLIAAAERGVSCRVLLDSIGSHEFLLGGLCKKARAAGVEIAEALPVRWLRSLYRRQDLRMHRKIIVIDGELAYTGSLNLVD
ncbi:MAG: phospholipase D-like domain-containing protein, partial [Verrucomicrobiota bacterium]